MLVEPWVQPLFSLSSYGDGPGFHGEAAARDSTPQRYYGLRTAISVLLPFFLFFSPRLPVNLYLLVRKEIN